MMSDDGPGKGRLTRRSFLSGVGTVAAALSLPDMRGPQAASAEEIGPEIGDARRSHAFHVRNEAAHLALGRPFPDHPANGEEQDYAGFIANYSKALPHNRLGEVVPEAYEALRAALESGEPAAYEAIPLGGPRKLTNPQAGLAFDLEGPDSHGLAMPPAPRIDGPENSAEMAELYWMALLRDVSFEDFERSREVLVATDDLSRFSDFRGPTEGGRVTPRTLFRGFTVGDLAGPYVSQFLLRDIPFGTLTVSQRQRTAAPSIDYLTDYRSWLAIQNGALGGPDRFERAPRYIRTSRDLATYVHFDALYEAYFNACLILLGMGAPLDPGNPYVASATQEGFGTFGGPHILSLVTEVATRALKAVWYQKWHVHRRLRPEEFGGRLHNHLMGRATYPIDSEILDSQAVEIMRRRYGTYLLPGAYPEGCPAHPAYGAGHATVAGACVTILKAWFDESFQLPDPVVPNAGGAHLVRYRGPAGSLTVGGELNKVAANVAIGRNMAGIHWRTDYTASVKLGEEIAIAILSEQKLMCHEHASFTLTKFDGTTITI